MKNPDLIINKKDEFFIAVAKKKYHSFVFLGVIKDNKPVVLLRIGKSDSINVSTSRLSDAKNFFLSKLESQMQQESLSLYGDISYSAFSIDYYKYLQFLKIAGFMQRQELIFCYQPIKEDEDTVQMQFKFLPLSAPDEVGIDEQDIVKKTHSLNFINTCRDTALDLINYTLKIVNIQNYASRLFFINLKIFDSFSRGKSNHHFYVFPIPPSDKLNSLQHKQLRMIYKRMENLVKKAPFAEETIQKFQALKKLYEMQADTSEKDINKALERIQKWKIENNPVISVLRKQSFIGKLFNTKASTVTLIEKLEDMLSKKI